MNRKQDPSDMPDRHNREKSEGDRKMRRKRGDMRT